MHVSRSIIVDSPVGQIYEIISDFHHWTAWSPWLVSEPGTKVTVQPDGKSYRWEGNRIGSGQMSIEREQPPSSLDVDLRFLKPWRSQAKVRFECRPDGDGTKVTWSMDSSLPFFLFWMKTRMQAFISADYDRGLAMLKEYIEEGQVFSKMTFSGISDFAGCRYVGFRSHSTIEQSGQQMAKDFDRLMTWMKEQALQPAAAPFCIYHKWDFLSRAANYTAAIPITSALPNLPPDMVEGSIPAIKVHTIRHRGRYLHLGNAWATQYMMHRNKEFRPVKGVDPFEVYISMPGSVADEDLITDVHFPVKA